MSVTYGLVRQTGPYAQPYSQQWARQNNITIDPWNQIVDTSLISPSPWAKHHVTTRDVPSIYSYRRDRDDILNMDHTTPGDVTALFGTTNNVSPNSATGGVDVQAAAQSEDTSNVLGQGQEVETSPTDSFHTAESGSPTDSFYTAESGTPMDPQAQELATVYPEILRYHDPAQDLYEDQGSHISTSPNSSRRSS